MSAFTGLHIRISVGFHMYSLNSMEIFYSYAQNFKQSSLLRAYEYFSLTFEVSPTLSRLMLPTER